MEQYSVSVTRLDIEAFLNSYDSYIKYQREIRNHYDTKVYSAVDHRFIKDRICKVALETINPDKIEAERILLFKKHKIERPTNVIVRNLVKEATDEVETYLFKYITATLDKENSNYKAYIDGSLLHLDDSSEETIISFLKQDSGKSNLDSINANLG